MWGRGAGQDSRFFLIFRIESGRNDSVSWVDPLSHVRHLVRTRQIMTASAFVLFAHGIVLLFSPDLLFRLAHIGIRLGESVLAQLFGAALVSLGLMNWNGRGMVLGGVYGRVLGYGNFAFWLITFLVSLRGRLSGFSNAFFWIEIAVSLGFAIAFSVMLFRGPIDHGTGLPPKTYSKSPVS